jgi:protoporphyrinogen oxidase
VFRFPQEGGTGAIWKKVAALLPADKQRYNTAVKGIDAAAKVLTLSDGSQLQYNKVRFRV